MVSFQCNACGDVCTKPKLDKHRSQCHSSFDCIDCSKRFNTPAEYKDHTSCISEAEKYQKGLYQGGGGRPQSGGRNNIQPSWNARNNSQQNGRGRPSFTRTFSRATGANDTPLGTPIRMSPVNDTPPAAKDNTPVVVNKMAPVPTMNSQETQSKKRKSHSNDTTQDVIETELEPPKKKKSKVPTDSTEKQKSKKSKKDASEPSSIPLPSSALLLSSPEKSIPAEGVEEKKKKDKKKPGSKHDEKKKKKSKPKMKDGEDDSCKDDDLATTESEPVEKPKKRKGEDNETIESTKKKSKKTKDPAAGLDPKVVDVPSDSPTEKKPKKSSDPSTKSKDRKKKKTTTDVLPVASNE